jgi:hypothetical protein
MPARFVGSLTSRSGLLHHKLPRVSIPLARSRFEEMRSGSALVRSVSYSSSTTLPEFGQVRPGSARSGQGSARFPQARVISPASSTLQPLPRRDGDASETRPPRSRAAVAGNFSPAPAVSSFSWQPARRVLAPAIAHALWRPSPARARRVLRARARRVLRARARRVLRAHARRVLRAHARRRLRAHALPPRRTEAAIRGGRCALVVVEGSSHAPAFASLLVPAQAALRTRALD